MTRRMAGLLLAVTLSSAAPAMPMAQIVALAPATTTPAVGNVVKPPSTAQSAEFPRATEQARQILAGAEFQQAEPSWWDRKMAQLRGWLARLFLGVDRLTTSAPWLGQLMEWVLFTAAAVGLLVWVLRTVQRQRLRMALGPQAPPTAMQWGRDTEDWRRIADEEAARQAWREAIHALYWAAIVHLERRRAWRHNPARTPREYVRLLRSGSQEQTRLRELTAVLERSWYGADDARAEEYESARASFQSLAAGAGQAVSFEAAGGGGA